MLSDIFHEKSQFEWMFQILLELHQNHHSGEDELMNQYVVLGLCKAVAVQHVTVSTAFNLSQHSLIFILQCISVLTIAGGLFKD